MPNDAPRAFLSSAPHSLDAEQAVLGCLLMQPSALASIDGLEPSDFFNATHRLIYTTIRAMVRQQMPVDALLAGEALAAQGKLEQIGGMQYLASLVTGTPSAANIAGYARVVAQCAARRHFQAIAVELHDRAGSAEDIEALRADAAARLAAVALDDVYAGRVLDLEVLAEHEPEAPAFILPDWLPIGYATLFAGHGGIGKSGLALLLAVCIAVGLPFFGVPVQRRRVRYLSCEDRTGVLHWRLSRICRHLGINMGVLRGSLEIEDLVGLDSILWERDGRGHGGTTAVYASLRQRIRRHQSEVLLIDGVSDTFGGDEIRKTDVKRYVNAIVALIPAERGAAILVGHIAKPAARNGATSEGYSGSAAWHNSVRARWYLYPETAASDDGAARPERTGDLILELQKSNLGRTDQSMRFAWCEDAQMFLGREIVPATSLDRAHRSRTEQTGILSAMKACAESSPAIVIPAASSGQRTAFHVLSAQPAFPETLLAAPAGRRRFWRHIEELRAMRCVNDAEWRQADRRKSVQLVLTSEGVRACGQ